MFKKLGQLEEIEGYENPILRNPQGEAYEVSFVTAYIWEKLDGQTSDLKIAEEISKAGNVQNENLESIVSSARIELSKFGLAQSIS
jgi:hypothetical protein